MSRGELLENEDTAPGPIRNVQNSSVCALLLMSSLRRPHLGAEAQPFTWYVTGFACIPTEAACCGSSQMQYTKPCAACPLPASAAMQNSERGGHVKYCFSFEG